MKKLLLFLLAAVMLCGTASCNKSGDGEGDTTVSTKPADRVTRATTTTVPVDKNPDIQHTDSTEEWVVDDSIDYSKYTYMGDGTTIVDTIKDTKKLAGYTLSYAVLNSDGTTKKTTEAEFRKVCNALVIADQDSTKKTLLLKYETADVKLVPEYTKVSGAEGDFFTISFTTNIPSTFVVSIGKTGAARGNFYHENIVPVKDKKTDGKYVGTAKLTIPYIGACSCQINFSFNSTATRKTLITSVPLDISANSRNSTYHLLFSGDWDLITDTQYRKNLVDLFYSVYPRLNARWGFGNEPKTVTFRADKDYDGVAYAMGTTVTVSTAYANSNPNDLGFFSHEITHSVQQYSGFNYGGDAWWTENMANYGGFRYFHWSNSKYVQIYYANDASLQNWNYEAYGNNKWFFAYMDSRYPTTVDKDGKYTYGLIDSINRGIKNRQLTDDDPRDTANPFNQLVKKITGYDCIESLRLRFVEELKEGTWNFTGFGSYTDNFLTENLPQVANPVYPEFKQGEHGEKTAAPLSETYTDGTNLCKGATVTATSGFIKDSEQAAYIVDGNPATKWCAGKGNVTDPTYLLEGVAHYVIIDLGEKKSFDTYTLYNAGSKEGASYNAKEWEILVSDDAKAWTSVDYQQKNTKSISSYNIGAQSARYILIKVLTPDNGSGTVRLYEFMLFNSAENK